MPKAIGRAPKVLPSVVRAEGARAPPSGGRWPNGSLHSGLLREDSKVSCAVQSTSIKLPHTRTES